MKYLAIDGDDIGRRLEQLLLSNRIEDAKEFSQKVEDELKEFRTYLERNDANIIFCSGDSLLAEVDGDFSLVASVLKKDDITWSGGIGESSSEAVLALKKAKGLGRNRVEEF